MCRLQALSRLGSIQRRRHEMDIQYQMDNLEKQYLAGILTDKEYDEAIDELIASQNKD